MTSKKNRETILKALARLKTRVWFILWHSI
jgi:hypothetical protein